MDAVERVRNMVRHSLVVSPNIRNDELYDRAKEIAPEVVKDLNIRQFHAKFRLPVLRHEIGRKRPRQPGARRKAGGTDGPSAPGVPRKRTARAARGGRADAKAARSAVAVREVLIEFAIELELAEARRDLIRVIGGLDGWVVRVMEAAQNPGTPAPGPEAAAMSDGRLTEDSGPDS